MKYYPGMADVSAIPQAWALDADAILTRSGQNLGNFAFRHAVPRLLREFAQFTPVTWPEFEAQTGTGPVDHLLLSCANWLDSRPRFDDHNHARAAAVEKSDRVTAFGLGVQAPAGAKQVTLGPGSQRLAHALAERGASVSVRDALTQEVLASYGITNTLVTGCPSNFINADPGLGQSIAIRAASLAADGLRWDDIRTLISEASPGHGSSRAVVTAQMRLMADHPVFYALQSPVLLPFYLREAQALPPDYASEAADPVALRRALVAFSSIEAWMDFARSCQLSVGMRIHGTMVPLQAGVPSLLIQHDSRTAGLATQMGVPAVSPEVYLRLQGQGPAAFFERIAQGMQPYDAHRQTLAAKMQDYITAHGLTPTGALAGLATGSQAGYDTRTAAMETVGGRDICSGSSRHGGGGDPAPAARTRQA